MLTEEQEKGFEEFWARLQGNRIFMATATKGMARAIYEKMVEDGKEWAKAKEDEG